MEWLIGGLAVIGALTLVSMLVRSMRSAARVRWAADELEEQTRTVIETAQREPENERKLFAEVTKWDAVRAAIAALPADEQCRVQRTLDSRGLPSAQAFEKIESWKVASCFEARTSNPEVAALFNLLGSPAR